MPRLGQCPAEVRGLRRQRRGDEEVQVGDAGLGDKGREGCCRFLVVLLVTRPRQEGVEAGDEGDALGVEAPQGVSPDEPVRPDAARLLVWVGGWMDGGWWMVIS